MVIKLSPHCPGEQQDAPNAENEGSNLARRESCGGEGPTQDSTVTATRDESTLSSSPGKPRTSRTLGHRSTFSTSAV